MHFSGDPTHLSKFRESRREAGKRESKIERRRRWREEKRSSGTRKKTLETLKMAVETQGISTLE